MARMLRSVVFYQGSMWRPGDEIPAEIASKFGEHVWTEDPSEVDGDVGFRGVADTPRSEGSLFDNEQLMRFGRPSTEAPDSETGPAPVSEVPVVVEDADTGAEDEDDAQDPAATATGPKAPPRSGRGSSLEAWRAHAADLGVQLPDDADRDDVMAAVDAHHLAAREAQK